MKFNLLLTLSFFIIFSLASQTKNNTDLRQPTEKPENLWNKQIMEITQSPLIVLTEGISYGTSDEGILLVLAKPTNNVKLITLTGDVFWSGNLVQGKFFIPVKQGIYFLKINNKSYKVVCK